MEPVPEDATWFLRWAVVLDKLKGGRASGDGVELSAGECATLLRGVHALSGNVRVEESS
jgi:hypothetical protein